MRLLVTTTCVLLFCVLSLSAQSKPTMKGFVYDYNSKKELNGVIVKITDTTIFDETNAVGAFELTNLPIGAIVIEITHNGFESQKIPLNISEDDEIDIGNIYLQPTIDFAQDAGFIVLNDDELSDDEQSSGVISGLFQASKDAYLKAAAFNFSQAWFKVRGYDSSYGTVSINGIEMNKLYDGRPQWSNWGGLNDVFRNQEFTNGIAPSEHSFGTVLGTTNFNTRASEYQKGGKISVALTNKSYTTRVMANYASGLTKNKWAYVISMSGRNAIEGYSQGTPYNARAVFIAVEKKLDKLHSFNLTALAATNKRGKSSPNTQEVFDLKDPKYNAYWGFQNGKIRNSRMKEIVEPIVMLSHFYEKENASIKTTLAYQFGHVGNSRLGYNNAPNPDPTYWKNLPSNFLRFTESPDYANAYLAEQNFKNNGQINWQEIYELNNNQENALYYLYEDRVDDKQISFNSNVNKSLSKNLQLNTGINYQNLSSKNYSKMLDLLGSKGFLDLDQYALGNAQQNNLNTMNRTVFEGDAFQYNYIINATTINAFTQVQATFNKVDFFAGINAKNTNYQRNGLYKNGSYPLNSFGKSDKLSFDDVGIKGGFTYKITGRHLFNVNAAALSNAPTIRTSFSNARVNNAISPDLESEKITTGDVNYIFRSPKVQTRLTAYYTQFKNAMETSFYFAEGIFGDEVDFVNEIVTGIEKKNIGAEFSVSYQILPTVKLTTAGSLGQFTYNNNPKLYLLSDNLNEENSDFGTAYLKNYHVSGTPQRAVAVGFEYRDPAYWWFQINGSLLTHNYVDISPLLRTDNFYKDANGIPFLDTETGVEITQKQVDDLLIQEKFDEAFLLDVVGGKSWKINDTYLGLFVGINNVLGEIYKTGGFEQARKANYPEVKEDKQLNKPIFGPKYWYGSQTSYYINMSVRF